MCIKFGTNEQYQQKTCFPSTRKVLDFDLNGQHMRKNEVPEGNWVLGCSPDHSTIRPKILSLKSQPSPKDKSERLDTRRKVVSSGFHSLVVPIFLLILSIVPIYIEHGCLKNLIFADFGPTEHSRRTILTFLDRRNMFRPF